MTLQSAFCNTSRRLDNESTLSSTSAASLLHPPKRGYRALRSIAPENEDGATWLVAGLNAVLSKRVTQALSLCDVKGRDGMGEGRQPWRIATPSETAGVSDPLPISKRMRAISLSAAGASLPAAGLTSREAQLIQFIRKQVIPQLASAYGLSEVKPSKGLDQFKPSHEALAELANLAVSEGASAVVAYVDALLARGVPIETVYLDWIAPAARQMGCDWETDRCNFSDVTIGMWTLQQALHSLSPVFLRTCAVSKSPRRILLVSVPGEQHTMGLYMMSEFFRRAGWDVWCELPSDYQEVMCKARSEWFDVIGLSVGSEHKIEALTGAIVGLRKTSRNAQVSIMAGGPIMVSNPEFAITLGVDFTATDARQAVARAEQMVSARISVSEQFRR